MHHRLNRRVRAAALTAAALLAATAGAVTPSAASVSPVTGSVHTSAEQPTGPLAKEMTELLKLQPTGIQLSDNTLYFPGSHTSVVWPSPGQAAAPVGIGANIRPDALKRAGITSVASEFGIQDVHGCPSGLTVADHYCFYTGNNFSGRRLQFTGATKAANASTWGFDLQTRGWVNTDTNVIPIAYNAQNHGGSILWLEPENASVGIVDSALINKLRSWTAD